MKIEKALLIRQYLRTEKVLREFFDQYTVPICVGHCVERDEERDCCVDQTPRITEIKVPCLAAEISALREAKHPQTTPGGCGYLTPTGCMLRKYRSVVCNTFVCQVLIGYLNLIRPGLGGQLGAVERLSRAIFGGFPEPAGKKIQKLEKEVSNLSRALDAIIPPGITTWEYIQSHFDPF